ncbi:3-polyprenyl-4-hydroxybenzoate decarboxylase (plasmid) [Halostagnicola larsenii XH-48]|uniref:3-polyprenyl-4-hydroxybenzoate decarboxylase n=1 Tax=Halostagnicola larsenii XH-48 TaxID=797299 RepID=W0JVP7_9EURY|nr:UbiD family decarboxylase [Halostagnicola larsenii]AHG01305.1 3-polyprenyl-4-hydroxybenzoate decarboxylase [Halostagnicola larsenii XH-48]
MTLRTQLDRLEQTNDLVTITEGVHWDETAATVAREAIRGGAPAALFETTPGRVRFASGVYGGPSQFSSRSHQSGQRIAQALGLGPDCSYVELLERLAGRETASVEDRQTEPAATDIDEAGDLHTLGLPTVGTDRYPLVSLGVLVAEKRGTTTWVPIRGQALHSTTLRLSVPEAFAEWCEPAATASVVLGASACSLLAALQGWTQDRTTPAVPELAAGLADIPMATVDSRVVPADAEVRIDGTLRVVEAEPRGPNAAWELTGDTATIEVSADRIATRESPIVSFTPPNGPMTDDVHLTSLVEAAQLFRRVNNYWGVSPVEWIQLPVEGRLGLCIVSSEILYAGFEWQLANTLFSFSNLFDKVVVLDEQADPTNLARAVNDMWVKAHPANDWTFSEPNAPAATATGYRRDGETGSRLYVNATWDPRWDEEYIAPRVTFETAFSENILEALSERWAEFGLDELLGDQDETTVPK